MMRFALANANHDAQLRALIAGESMPGWVRLGFRREPSFFEGIVPQGHMRQVVALFDGHDVVGMGCRSIRTVFLDGEPREFGYLSALRSLPHVRQGMLLARGYRFLRDLHGDGRVPGYLTTIVESNREAIAILTSGRAGLPAYIPLGGCRSYAIPLCRRSHRNRPVRKGLRVESGGAVGVDALDAFIAREGARRQFFPVLRIADLGKPPYVGLVANDFRVALRGNAIAGLVAVWDQRRFCQTVAVGYAPPLNALRPLLNVLCRFAGYPTLPVPGGTLNMACLAFLCVRDHDADVVLALLDAVRSECAGGDLQFLCMGLHEADPLNAALCTIRCLHFDSRLYVACWEDTRAECEGLRRARVPHVELAML